MMLFLLTVLMKAYPSVGAIIVKNPGSGSGRKTFKK
jgi:hypothetical protein